MAAGITHIVHYEGKPMRDGVRKSRRSAREEAARITGKPAPTFDGKYDSPHVMRHTAATWMRKRGVPSVEAANYLGMSFEIYERVYAHMAPDFQEMAAGLKSKL